MDAMPVIRAATGRLSEKQAANALSVATALTKHGAKFGLDQPHRLAQYLPQLAHESGSFNFDKELWGPTPAQERYDTRTDLGNTPERDGDGFMFRGHGPIQVTGRSNHCEFRDWCRRNIDPNAPDFEAQPDLINTDPWEGLTGIWYWSTRRLNRYADEGDIEMITKRINGGLNGYADRLEWYTRFALVLLGYGRGDVVKFQQAAGLEADGIAGPRTRAGLHFALVRQTAPVRRDPDIKLAPVTEKKPTVPETVETEVKKKTSLWGWITSAISGGGMGAAGLLGADWQTIAAIFGGLVVVLLIGILLRRQIIGAVRDIRSAVEDAS